MENYECLVIDCKTQSKLEDQFLAQQRSIFQMCSIEMWNMQSLEDQRSYKDSVNDDEDDENTMRVFLQRKK